MRYGQSRLINQRQKIHLLQAFANNVMEDYFHSDRLNRSAYYGLLLIAKYWETVKINHFTSEIDYYKTLAQTTDFLLKGLVYNEDGKLEYIAGLPVIIRELGRKNCTKATVYLFDWDQDEATILCNELRDSYFASPFKGELIVSVCSLSDGRTLILYDEK